MRSRICLVGAALSAGLLTSGAPGAMAAGKSKPKPVRVDCATNVGIMIAGGDTTVVPPVSQGREYGTAFCGRLLGGGVQADAFIVPDSGDTLTGYVLYFRAGTIRGRYDLTPQEGSFAGTNFSEVDSSGTLTITGGTGVFFGARGTGTMTCKTLDGIHTGCFDKLALTRL